MFESQFFQPTNTVNHSLEFSMPSQVFQKTCRDLKAFLKSDTVTIKCQQNMVSFIGEGTFGNLQIDLEDPLITIRDFKKSCTVNFSLPYLGRFAKTPLSSTIGIKIGEEIALVCVYEIENMGDVHYFLAPKVMEI